MTCRGWLGFGEWLRKPSIPPGGGPPAGGAPNGVFLVGVKDVIVTLDTRSIITPQFAVVLQTALISTWSPPINCDESSTAS
jgi:hypothetical protein